MRYTIRLCIQPRKFVATKVYGNVIALPEKKQTNDKKVYGFKANKKHTPIDWPNQSKWQRYSPFCCDAVQAFNNKNGKNKWTFLFEIKFYRTELSKSHRGKKTPKICRGKNGILRLCMQLSALVENRLNGNRNRKEIGRNRWVEAKREKARERQTETESKKKRSLKS